MSSPKHVFTNSRLVTAINNFESWCQYATHSQADIVELRYDGMLQGKQQLLQHWPEQQVLFTYRHPAEGGMQQDFSFEQRNRAILEFLPHIGWVDIELAYWEQFAPIADQVRKAGVKIILSQHNFSTQNPAEFYHAACRQAKQLGVDVIKFAFQLQQAAQIQLGVEILEQTPLPCAVMGMGELAAASRILYAQHGSVLTYGYIGKSPTAPGQWSEQLWREVLQNISPLRTCAQAQAGQPGALNLP